MKSQVKKIARTMAGWPVIGPFVRMSADVYRIRHLRAVYLDLNHRQHTFETSQLPTILAAISDINHRLTANTSDQENLVKSAPIALRKITRDISSIKKELELSRLQKENLEKLNYSIVDISNSLGSGLAETKDYCDRMKEDLNKDIGGTQERLEHLTSSIDYLLGRVEFVRRELMYEMRYGASSPSTENGKLQVKTEVLAKEKFLNAQSTKIRLNLGCGHVPIAGYLNVDRRALTGVDIVAEIDDLPFGDSEIDEIFSAHLLEHFPQEQLRRELLPYFFKLLKPGGKFHAIVPDGEAMTAQAAKDPGYFESFRLVTYGAQDYDGDFHFNMFSPETLSTLLKEAGFSNIKIIERARRNDICYEFELESFK